MDTSNVIEGGKQTNKPIKPQPKQRRSTYHKKRQSSKKRPVSVVQHITVDHHHHHDHSQSDADDGYSDLNNSDAVVHVPLPKPRGGNSRFNNILRELYETERDYLTSLGEIIDGYQRQLQTHVTEEELVMIFGNIDDLYDFHVELCADIETYYNDKPHMIGEVFVKMGLKRFMVYEKYYLDHMKSMSFLLQKQEDTEFLQLLVGCQKGIGHQLPLADYLLRPVQRLLKYPLLLHEMTKHSTDEGEGKESLVEASKVLKNVADNINEIKRKLDVSKYVESLQKRLLSWDGPDLVTFGCLKDAGDFKVSDSSNKKSLRQVLLFELGILICKPRAQGFVSVKHYFKMDDLYLQTMLNEALCFRLTLAHNKKVYFTFYCKNREDKQYWIAKIKKVIIDYHTQGMKPLPPPASTKPTKKKDRRTTGRKRYSSAPQRIEKAPVSKRAVEDVKLMHNPFAQAGGFEGDAPDVKQLHRKEITKRSNNMQRNNSSRNSTRDSCLLPPNDEQISRKGNRGSKRFSSRPQSEVYDDYATQEQLKVQEQKDLEQQKQLELEQQQKQLEQQQEIETKRFSRPMSTLEMTDGEEEDQVCVVRCNFPDKTHTSVIIKTGDTMEKAFTARLARRELSPKECIIEVPAEPELNISWGDEAISALQGHTVIRVTKIKCSPQKLKKGVVVRVPSGNILIINDDASNTNEGVVKSSPQKLGSRKSLNLNTPANNNLLSEEPVVIDGSPQAVHDSSSELTSQSNLDCEALQPTHDNADDGTERTASSTEPMETNPTQEQIENGFSTTAAAGSIYNPSHGPKPKFPMRKWRASTRGKPTPTPTPSTNSTTTTTTTTNPTTTTESATEITPSTTETTPSSPTPNSTNPTSAIVDTPSATIPTPTLISPAHIQPSEVEVTAEDGYVENKIEQFGGAPKRASTIKQPFGRASSESVVTSPTPQPAKDSVPIVEEDTDLPAEDVSKLARKFSNKCKVQPLIDEGSIRYRTKQPNPSPTKRKHHEIVSPPIPRRRMSRPVSQLITGSNDQARPTPAPAKRTASMSMKVSRTPTEDDATDSGKVMLRRGTKTNRGSGKINVKRWDSAETHRNSNGDDASDPKNASKKKRNSNTQDEGARNGSTGLGSPASKRASWRTSAYDVVGLGGVRTAKALQNRPAPQPRERSNTVKMRPPPKTSFGRNNQGSTKKPLRPPAVSDFNRNSEGGIHSHRDSVKHKIAQFGGSIKLNDTGTGSKKVRTLSQPLTPRHTDV